MLINPSKDVDANGKVFHAYLHYWDYRSSNLVNTVGILQQAFAVDPPVYARPHNQPPPTTVHPPPQFVPTLASTGSAATGMPPQPSGSSQLSSPTSLLNSRIPNTLPPPMDPHAIKLNALRADVADKLTAKFAEFSSALTSEMEALLHENKVLYEAQTRVQQKADALDQGVVQLGTNLAFSIREVPADASELVSWHPPRTAVPLD
ncbi:hypothetical protein AMAG_18026 [Allomyces macrogynus ATCC 38327]|uniref:UEV domain-containing protein n=1 Tax=Allomyces macrogynus (strain ATCC 38327) TaxID=578462 RepID=A0A0L0S486_ALLM3|nr:hypothetical protein AMAG_18026 [Allomyces macrogynus ATCC 38327]|eukprot:KNE57255.1 hypothetical protein AMAG_18026 [Allomyces macrogynus ATCC 38327]